MSEEEECKVLQDEETEVLSSIYEGDTCFSSEPDSKSFLYKYGKVKTRTIKQSYLKNWNHSHLLSNLQKNNCIFGNDYWLEA